MKKSDDQDEELERLRMENEKLRELLEKERRDLVKERECREAERKGRIKAEKIVRSEARERVGGGFELRPIGIVKSCFPDRRGTPRQPLCVLVRDLVYVSKRDSSGFVGRTPGVLPSLLYLSVSREHEHASFGQEWRS